MTAPPLRDPAQLFAPPAVVLERRPDGSLVLRSPTPLGPYPPRLSGYLDQWAERAPDRPFLRERGPEGNWRGPSYAEAHELVRRIATGLLELGLGSSRPVAILSDNSVEHGLLMLAALEVGVPVVPISPAYSLLSRDFAKLKTIIGQVDPGLVYVASRGRYGPAVAALAGIHRGTVVSGSPGEGKEVVPFSELARALDGPRVAAAARAVGPETIAKLLFTSGSTGDPKGVVNTQRMLSANQQAKAQVWPFLAEHPPVIVDWLPWSHTFGGNHNFNLVLRHGGTLYIDAGRPVPPLFEATLANLREVPPTLYFNVPRGYDLLVAALESDAALRRTFFSRLQVLFSAAAALPEHLWTGLDRLARKTCGEAVPMVSAWGSTETAPLATDCHYQAERTGVIGLPVPGTDLKLVPNGEKLEVLVRGPNVTPGYWKRPDLTAAHFDHEGFYRIGDAVKLVDPAEPSRGLLFDGRVAEDFKLDTGTWVNVGMLRMAALAALAPVAQDVVVAGHDRREVALLVVPNLVACRGLAADLGPDAGVDQVLGHGSVREAVRRGLARLRAAGGGSSSYATRALLLTEPPSVDRGEITDKGYLNQRAVLADRSALVELVYGTEADPRVIMAEPVAGAGRSSA